MFFKEQVGRGVGLFLQGVIITPHTGATLGQYITDPARGGPIADWSNCGQAYTSLLYLGESFGSSQTLKVGWGSCHLTLTPPTHMHVRSVHLVVTYGTKRKAPH